MTYIPPKVDWIKFTCPHCNAITQHVWRAYNFHRSVFSTDSVDGSIKVSMCSHCTQATYWVNNKMYYPDNGNAPAPNPDMPENVKILYLEASSILSKSPRGAAALLRLGIQILCKELGEPGDNINADISSLVKKGLPPIVQKSLDIVRVTGNEAVHPGQIDTDNEEVVSNLFRLTNVIVEYMISLPKQISGIYDGLPADKKAAIEKRDSPKS